MIYVIDGIKNIFKENIIADIKNKYPNVTFFSDSLTSSELIKKLQQCLENPEQVYLFDSPVIYKIQYDKYINQVDRINELKSLNTFLGKHKKDIKFIYIFSSESLYRMWLNDYLQSHKLKVRILTRIDFYADYVDIKTKLKNSLVYDRAQTKLVDIIPEIYG